MSGNCKRMARLLPGTGIWMGRLAQLYFHPFGNIKMCKASVGISEYPPEPRVMGVEHHQKLHSNSAYCKPVY